MALIDGGACPPVVGAALAGAPYEVIGASSWSAAPEKLRGAFDYGVPLVEGFDGAEVVVDLSDEPVLGPAERMAWASRALAAGLPLHGRRLPLRSAGVRPGSARPSTRRDPGQANGSARPPSPATSRACSRATARWSSSRWAGAARLSRSSSSRPVGGRPRRALASRTPCGLRPPRDCRALRRARHVGCRRAGGGLAGRCSSRTSSKGVASGRTEARRGCLRLERHGDPAGRGRPARARGRAGSRSRCALQPLPPADLRHRRVGRRRARGGAFSATLRLRPLEPLEGRVAVFTAGGWTSAGSARTSFYVRATSATALALAEDLARVDADTYLMELKGAAIDVVAEHALARGRRRRARRETTSSPGLDEALSAPPGDAPLAAPARDGAGPKPLMAHGLAAGVSASARSANRAGDRPAGRAARL